MTMHLKPFALRLVPRRHVLAACLALGAMVTAPSANAQTVAPPSNVVQLQASGVVDVPQDWLTVRLSTTREAPDAATVQNQLKQATEAALASLRAQVRPGEFEVRTGAFGVYPRYASAVAQAVAAGEVDGGILICGTGIGVSIAANKVKGAYCALLADPYSAQRATLSNNANMVAMGAQTTGIETAKVLLENYLANTYDPNSRSAPKVARVTQIESEQK